MLLKIVAFILRKWEQNDFPSIPVDKFKDHYIRLFDLTSMQDVTKNYHFQNQFGEPLRLELNFTFPVERTPLEKTELIVLGKRLFSVAVDKFGVAEKIWNG